MTTRAAELSIAHIARALKKNAQAQRVQRFKICVLIIGSVIVTAAAWIAAVMRLQR
jgi:hypothetical protein